MRFAIRWIVFFFFHMNFSYYFGFSSFWFIRTHWLVSVVFDSVRVCEKKRNNSKRTVKNEIQTWTEFRFHGLRYNFCFAFRNERIQANGECLAYERLFTHTMCSPWQICGVCCCTFIAEHMYAIVHMVRLGVYALASNHKYNHKCIGTNDEAKEKERRGKKQKREKCTALPHYAVCVTRMPWKWYRYGEFDATARYLFSFCLIQIPPPADTEWRRQRRRLLSVSRLRRVCVCLCECERRRIRRRSQLLC